MFLSIFYGGDLRALGELKLFSYVPKVTDEEPGA